jgi:hypothetical protein
MAASGCVENVGSRVLKKGTKAVISANFCAFVERRINNLRFHFPPLDTSKRVFQLVRQLTTTIFHKTQQTDCCLFASGHQKSAVDIFERPRLDIDDLLSFAIRGMACLRDW